MIVKLSRNMKSSQSQLLAQVLALIEYVMSTFIDGITIACVLVQIEFERNVLQIVLDFPSKVFKLD